MAAQPDPALLSVDQYLTLERQSEERHEYVDGHISLLAGGTADHGALSLNIGGIVRALLRGGTGRAYPSDVRVQVSATRYLYPDVSVSCDERDRGRVEAIQAPRLIVEVLSPRTEAYDRGKKFGYYRACPTVQEYVLVNTTRPELEVYRRAGNFWTLHTFAAADTAELASLDLRFPVAEVYEGGELPDEEGAG